MALRSGTIEILSTAGASQGPSTPSAQNANFIISADSLNTTPIFVGNDGSTANGGLGDVDETTGLALGPGENISVNLPQLSDLWFETTSTTSTSNTVSWLYNG